MLYDDDTAEHPRLGLPLPEIQAEEPSEDVLNAVRRYAEDRQARYERLGGTGEPPHPCRVQATVRRRYGIDAPVEQIAGALQQL